MILAILLAGVLSTGSSAQALSWSVSDQGLADNAFIPFVGTFGGTSVRFADYGHNQSGQRVGSVGYATPFGRIENHAAIINSNNSVLDLGVLGGAIPPQLMGYRFSSAYDINNAGQVVGQSSNDKFGMPTYSAFIWRDGAMQDLGKMDNFGIAHNYNAMGINNLGQAVGYASYDGARHDGNYSAAFLWDDGKFINLTEMIFGNGWAMEFAFDINDAGQIIGTARMPDGYHTIIATPNVIPEPSTLLLLGAGLLGFSCFRRRV
jgi:probable HAF family extracellular repeat protein